MAHGGLKWKENNLVENTINLLVTTGLYLTYSHRCNLDDEYLL